jgi:hypothetical protein
VSFCVGEEKSSERMAFAIWLRSAGDSYACKANFQ